MLSIGIGEIQRNTSIFTNLTQAIQIIDKRKKEILAMVYPIQKGSVVNKLAGKYKNKVKTNILSDCQIKQQAMLEAMEDKYGLSS